MQYKFETLLRTTRKQVISDRKANSFTMLPYHHQLSRSYLSLYKILASIRIKVFDNSSIFDSELSWSDSILSSYDLRMFLLLFVEGDNFDGFAQHE